MGIRVPDWGPKVRIRGEPGTRLENRCGDPTGAGYRVDKTLNWDEPMGTQIFKYDVLGYSLGWSIKVLEFLACRFARGICLKSIRSPPDVFVFSLVYLKTSGFWPKLSQICRELGSGDPCLMVGWLSEFRLGEIRMKNFIFASRGFRSLGGTLGHLRSIWPWMTPNTPSDLKPLLAKIKFFSFDFKLQFELPQALLGCSCNEILKRQAFSGSSSYNRKWA